MKNLIIEGFIGSGKGAVGRALGRKLGLNVVDLDKKVADRMKMTASEIYDRFGDVYFRAMETLILRELTESEEAFVLVLGSGAAQMPQNAEVLKKLGTVVYIRLPIEAIIRNMKASKKHGWIQEENWDEQVEKLFREREPGYRATADVTIEAEGKKSAQIVSEIMERTAG